MQQRKRLSQERALWIRLICNNLNLQAPTPPNPPKLIWGVQCAHQVKCSEGQFIFWHSLAFLWSLSCRWGVVQLLYSMHASLNCICNAASRRWGRPHWVAQEMFIAQVRLQRSWWMSCKLNWSSSKLQCMPYKLSLSTLEAIEPSALLALWGWLWRGGGLGVFSLEGSNDSVRIKTLIRSSIPGRG